jgi:long-chain fatty acid transport protein
MTRTTATARTATAQTTAAQTTAVRTATARTATARTATAWTATGQTTTARTTARARRAVATGAAALGIWLATAATGPERTCRASGFLIYDISGEAIGRASAVSAGISEPSAVWFNPAALTDLRGVSASAGTVFVTARSTFSPAAGGGDTDSNRGNFFLPTLFAHAALNDSWAAGMGVYTAFGIGIRWPDGWVGREAAIAASLQTVAFNPTLAFKPHPQFSMAAGFDAIRAAVDFTNGLPAIVGGDVRLAGGTWGYGFNLAALYRIVPERLQVALMYRSRVKLSFKGNADFSPANPDFERSLPDQPGTAAITLPDIITAGVMGRPRSDLMLGFDANLVLWQSYDRIDITFSNPGTPGRTIQPDGHNAFTLRAGVDWAAERWPGLHVRGGLIFDRSAIRAEGLGPGLPDADRVDATLGVGYARGKVKADVGYMLVYFLPADAKTGREGPEGTYHTIAHLIGLTLAVSWPAQPRSP